MSRRIQVYVSSDLFKSCLLIAQSKSDEMRKFTVEDVIEGFIKDVIKEKYPQISFHQKEVDKLEKQLIKILGATNDNPNALQ